MLRRTPALTEGLRILSPILWVLQRVAGRLQRSAYTHMFLQSTDLSCSKVRYKVSLKVSPKLAS